MNADLPRRHLALAGLAAVVFSAAVGAGYYGSFFLLEGRYQEGLTDIADFDEELGTTDDSYRNRSVVVMVGVRFGR